MAPFTEYSREVLSLVTELSTVSLIALGAILALIIIAVRWGKQHIVTLIASLYIGYLAYISFPFTESVVKDGALLPGLGLFAVCVGAAFFILRRVISTGYDDGGTTRWIDAVLLALAGTFLGAVFIYTLFPIPHTPILTPVLTQWLTTETFFFWWLVLPLIIIFVTTRQ